MRVFSCNFAAFVCFFLAGLAPAEALLATDPALGAPMVPAHATAGTLLVRSDDDQALRPMPMLSTDVAISVTGLIARTAVTQYFHNPTDEWLEGIYVFPLPQNAAVDTLEMRIGERVVVGEIKERGEAKRIYEQAKAAGKKAALLEQERPNIFTTSVAGIHPGGTVGVRIEYQRELDYRDGGFSLRFPMVVGPRYVPGSPTVEGFAGTGWAENTDQVPDGARITPVVADPAGGPINPVAIQVTLNAGVPVTVASPSHAIRTASKDGELHIELQAGPVPAERDFVLEWRPASTDAPRAALFTETFNGETYALLMVMPPSGEALQAKRLAREVIFVIDTSGSMAGTSFREARTALRLALKRLSPRDSFNIVAFDSTAQRLYRRSVAATPERIGHALRRIEALTADGGTEMLAALKLALDGNTASSGVRQVVFITDGAVGNETALFDFIKSHIGASRLFTVGIGSAPNGYFMRRAAEAGRGTFTYIGRPEEVQTKMSELFARLESPVLGDIAVQWPGVVTEVFPERIPDLYLGEPLVMVVKASQLTGAVHFSGMRARARWQQSVTLSGGAAQGGIARLFARRKIDAVNLEQGHLRRELGREQARVQVRSKIVELGLAYHLVTRHTSLVAVEKERSIPAGEKVKPWPVPVNLPAGWEMEAIWGEDQDDASSTAMIAMMTKAAPSPADKGRKQQDELRKSAPTSQDALLVALNQRLPQTATSASLLLLAGLLLLGVALLLRRRGRA